MKRRVYIMVSVVVAFLIIAGIMLSIKMTNKNTQNRETIGQAEETQEQTNIQALETEPQVPETWDLNKVYPVLSEDNIYVPVPIGWTISTSEDERYVNGNVTKKGTISNLTFTSTGDYPWTQNSSDIWVSGNTGVANSTSELISNEIEVGTNGGWVEIECRVYTNSSEGTLYMYVNDIVNGTSEQMPKEITGKYDQTYTKCRKELAQGKYTISIKFTNGYRKADVGSGYVRSGTYIEYDENGTDELEIHKTGGFVIYEGTDPITDLWTASKERNQFVWVPVEKPSETLYEKNATTGKLKARLWNFVASKRVAITNPNGDSKREPGVLNIYLSTNYDGIKYLSQYNLPGYSQDAFYKELEIEYKNTINAIEKYGGFYIGRYETGNVSATTGNTTQLSKIPVVKRMNEDISSCSWYDAYNRMKNISTNSNIQTSMIWGSLFDETLEWIIKSGDKVRVEVSGSGVASWGNYQDCEFSYTNTSGTVSTKSGSSPTRIPTGSTERNMANNIYDLCGNVCDWTLEGENEKTRVYRGGGYKIGKDSYGPASQRYGKDPRDKR